MTLEAQLLPHSIIGAGQCLKAAKHTNIDNVG